MNWWSLAVGCYLNFTHVLEVYHLPIFIFDGEYFDAARALLFLDVFLLEWKLALVISLLAWIRVFVRVAS